MADTRLSSHITEQDVRTISDVITPTIVVASWNAAIDLARDELTKHGELSARGAELLDCMKRRQEN